MIDQVMTTHKLLVGSDELHFWLTVLPKVKSPKVKRRTLPGVRNWRLFQLELRTAAQVHNSRGIYMYMYE